jgi:ubiquinone/menaquinone biosynthesis C-methylase UbiE
MNIKEAYNQWAKQYDSNDNKTRDLEGIVLREILGEIHFDTCLEVGCGTGKNTEWLSAKAGKVLAVDFSEEMLNKARLKIKSDHVAFEQADITQEWKFTTEYFELISFSLVLEHIENLGHIFVQATNHLQKGGYVYIGELHPFKQYAGSKARFESEEGLQVLICYNHHISDFTLLANKYKFDIIKVNEYFDNNDRTTIPRILALLLRKN